MNRFTGQEKKKGLNVFWMDSLMSFLNLHKKKLDQIGNLTAKVKMQLNEKFGKVFDGEKKSPYF